MWFLRNSQITTRDTVNIEVIDRIYVLLISFLKQFQNFSFSSNRVSAKETFGQLKSNIFGNFEESKITAGDTIYGFILEMIDICP